jgi:hypothetical protein
MKFDGQHSRGWNENTRTRTDCWLTGLYTDESPGLKVDPVIVLVLSLGFIFSVVALHSMFGSYSHVAPSSIMLTYF